MKSSGMTTPIVLATLVVSVLVAGLAATAAARPSHTSTIRLPGSGVPGGLPWECCDFVEQHPLFRPPMWRCNDVVDKCSAACHECVESPAGGGYVCRDWVTSIVQPPVCTPRPWDCCDFAICTRAYIPTCQCVDKVESCPSNCKECELVESSDPPRYRCLDLFHGLPGPKCSPWISKGTN